MPQPLRILLATCLVLLGTACLILLASLPAAAHQERPVTSSGTARCATAEATLACPAS